MAKIFKPRRASRDKINTDTSIKLDDGELMFVKKEKTNPKSSFDIYIGNTGLDPVKNMKPALYGDTAEEPMSYIDNPSVTSTSQALDLVRAGRSFGQTIGALKKAIELFRVEQLTWNMVPIQNTTYSVPGFFLNNFENITSEAMCQHIDPNNKVRILTDEQNVKYLDLTQIKDNMIDLAIKATFDNTSPQIVIPFSIPKIYMYDNILQAYRSGYYMTAPNPPSYPLGTGGEISFKISQQRLYFDLGYLNGYSHDIKWKFCWRELN